MATPLPPPEEPAPPERRSLELSVEAKALLKTRSNLLASFSYAVDGLLRTLNTQRNMKIHWVSGLAVMLVGMALELDVAARASVMFCVFVVICMETLNTAFEAFVDLHVKQYERHAMIAKDAAAAAVLVLALSSVVVFSDILFHRWRMVLASELAIMRTLMAGLPLLGIVAAILALPRNMVVITILGAIAIALLTFLAWFSRDEVFSLAALGFVSGAMYARVRERDLTELK